MGTGGVPQRLPTKHPRLRMLPTTTLGRWAVGLELTAIVLTFAWSVIPFLGGFPGVILALVGGIVALVAIVRRGERSVTVVLALLPFLLTVLFVLAELLVGHD